MNYRDFPLFADLDDAELRLLTDGCQQRTYQAGQLLMTEGAADQEVFFVHSGQMRVFLKTPKGQQELAQISGPALVGEMEWFTGEKRQASVVAVTEVQAMIMPFDALQTRLHDNCVAMLKVVYNIGRVVANRLTVINRRFSEAQEGQSLSPEILQLKKKLFADWAL